MQLGVHLLAEPCTVRPGMTYTWFGEVRNCCLISESKHNLHPIYVEKPCTYLDIPGGDEVLSLLRAECDPEGEAPALRRAVEGEALRRAEGHQAAVRAHLVRRHAAEETRIHSLVDKTQFWTI